MSAQPQQPSATRMSIASVARGKSRAPDRILLVGTEGVGKSTFAAQSPGVVFIGLEDGLRRIDVAKFPEPQSFEDVLAAIDALTNEPHDYKAVAIDTVDWLEPLIWRSLCHKHKWLDAKGQPDIESPGYGKGYAAAVEEFRLLLARLDGLRGKRGMEIILVGHSFISTFQNPMGADYSRYELQVNKKVAALLKQWADVVLFAAHEEFTTDKKKGSVKGISTGNRIVHTERTAAWDAKNRYSLPPVLPLDYEAYDAARDAGQQADPAELVKACVELADKLSLPADAPARKFVETNKNNPGELVRGLNRLRTLASETAA